MENNIPREALDGVRDAIGRSVKLSFKRLVKVEIRPEKIESRILAVTQWRVFVLSARAPFRIEANIHVLDIKTIESKKPNQLTLVTSEGKKHSFIALEVETEEFNHVITNIAANIKAVFPNVPLDRHISQIEVIPESRLKSMHTIMKDIEGREMGPCGGFSRMYACMCDFSLLPYREEVTWDIDTIYLSQDNKELSLGDFDHLESRDLVPIIAALEYNNWFTKLNASNIKLCQEASNEILKVMKKNSSIEELHLSGIGVKNDFAQKLSTALLSNPNSPLTTIDLSNNYIEDRGMNQLSGPFSKLSKGLTCLRLAKTGITAKGVNRLGDALTANRVVLSSLQELDLSENNLRSEEITNLYNFLAQPNAISTLNLSATECALDTLSGALLRGCCSHLKILNLSKNIFTHRKGKDINIPLSWKQFFATCISLKSINLADNKLPAEAVKNLMLGLCSNGEIKAVDLNLRGNDMRGAGAQVLEVCLPDLKNIASLDISDNGFGEDIVRILQKLLGNRNLTRLAIGHNFNSVKSKHLHHVLDAVVQFIEDDNCFISSLSVANSKLGKDTAVIINALGSNTSLKEIDISGNYMGDLGARMLAKALMINTHLTTIFWDKNLTSANGFTDVAAALQKNYTVKKMPTPVNDASNALRSAEKTEAALEKIEALLQRNHSPRKFACDQVYRLQQCFLLGTNQQMIDRQMVQLQDSIKSLQRAPSNSQIQTAIEEAQLLMKDADNSKLLLPRLQEVALKSEAAGNDIDVKLRAVAEDVWLVMEQQLKKNVTEMMTCASKHCPTVTQNKELTDEVREVCVEKSALPKDFAHDLIVNQVGTDTMNKVSELNLAVAAHVSERLIDNVIDRLTDTNKSMTNRLNEQKAVKRVKSDHEKENEIIIQRQKSEVEKPSPVDSPKVPNKRQSRIIRKTRPQSQIDPKDVKLALSKLAAKQEGSEGMSGRAPTPTIAEEGSGEGTEPTTLGYRCGGGGSDMVNDGNSQKGSKTSLGDLPPVEMPPAKLEHVTKSRPRRAGTRAPTRMGVPRCELVSDVLTPDQDMDSFFQTALVSNIVVTPTVNNTNSVSTNSVDHPRISPPKEEKKQSGRSPFGNIQQGINKFFNKKSSSSAPPPKSPDTTKRHSRLFEEEVGTPPTGKKSFSRDEEKAPPKLEVAEETPKTSTDIAEEDVVAEPVVRRPAGVSKIGLPGMGLGGTNLLQEMKAKRSTMGSKFAKVEPKEKQVSAGPSPASGSLKPKTPSIKAPAPAPPMGNEHIPALTPTPSVSNEPSPASKPQENSLQKPTPTLRPKSPVTPKEGGSSLKPTPAPRTSSPRDGPGDRTSKPPPPTRPKPKITAPKPSVPAKRVSVEPPAEKIVEPTKPIEERASVEYKTQELKPKEEKPPTTPVMVMEEQKVFEIVEDFGSKDIGEASDSKAAILDANSNEQIVLPGPTFIKTKSATLPRSPKVERKEESTARPMSLQDNSLSADLLTKQMAVSKILLKNGSGKTSESSSTDRTPDSSSMDSLIEDISGEQEMMDKVAVKIAAVVTETSSDSPVPSDQQSSSERNSEDEEELMPAETETDNSVLI